LAKNVLKDVHARYNIFFNKTILFQSHFLKIWDELLEIPQDIFMLSFQPPMKKMNVPNHVCQVFISSEEKSPQGNSQLTEGSGNKYNSGV
jgi:hypothetical protein